MSFGGKLSDREPIQYFSESGEIAAELPTSLSLGDPTMHEVLQWHIGLCRYCFHGIKAAPPPFGAKDNRKCLEYYEIATEYSEYEATYVRMGNP
jgi:hypothetical protein